MQNLNTKDAASTDNQGSTDTPATIDTISLWRPKYANRLLRNIINAHIIGNTFKP